MPGGVYDGNDTFHGGDIAVLLSSFIGETITIFISAGDQSISGFTGVILAVNEAFVRLLTRTGPSPVCSINNSCSDINIEYKYRPDPVTGAVCINYNDENGQDMITSPNLTSNEVEAFSSGSWGAMPAYAVGSLTDVPVGTIVSFVYNAE